MDVQRWLLHHALRSTPLHDSSFAYRSGRSAAGCARRHIGARWVIKADLHDFFGSVTERHAYGAFRAAGYGELVAFEMSRLCTRVEGRVVRGSSRQYIRYPEIRSYVVQSMGVLPQGGPTSGVLANFAATPLDEALSGLARGEGLVYTRYSDDIALSTPFELGRAQASRVVKRVHELILESNFRPHYKKARVVPPGARKIILGVVLGDDAIKLRKEFRRRVEVHVRGAAKFGLASHAADRKFDSPFTFINHVEGSLVYALDVDPRWASALMEQWNDVLEDSGLGLLAAHRSELDTMSGGEAPGLR